MAETTDLAKVNYQDKIIAVDNSSFASYLDTAKFEQIQRVAKMFAASDQVPEHFRNKPANCVIAVQMAIRLDIEPAMFIQNSYVVHGKPGMQSIVAIALVNARGPFTGPIQWRFEGKDKTRQCTAYATHRVTKEVCEATVTWAMVEAEGWNKKTGSKWVSMPDVMFRYRSASFLAKFYCPEVILGMPTNEELEDIESGNQYKPAAPTGRIEERMAKKAVESQIVESETSQEPARTEEKGSPATGQDSSELDELNQIAPPPNNIPENERYYCPKCEGTFPTAKGDKKSICPNDKCLSKGVIDRWLKK